MRRLIAALAFILTMNVLPIGAANVFVSTVVIGMSTRQANTYTFSSIAVPTGVKGLSFTMDVSEATNPLPELSASLEGSLDGGTTWIPAGAFGRVAGPKFVNPLGVTQTIAGGTFIGGDFWNDTTNVNRRLRGSATIGGTMRFSMTVQPL